MISNNAIQELQGTEIGVISAKNDLGFRSSAPGTNLGGLLDIAMEIAAARRQIMRQLRAALLEGDDFEALNYARQLCGVE